MRAEPVFAMFASQAAAPPPAVSTLPSPSAKAAASPLHPTSIRVVHYGFEHADLGMSLARWRAASPDQATAPCAPAPHDPKIVVCTPAAEVGGRYNKRDRRAVFVNGVLAQLSFSTSINSFDGVMARLDKTYGRPAKVVRDTIRLGDGLVLPHVLMTWTNGLETIRITDPEPPGGLLTVRATLDADPERIPVVGFKSTS
jgi:hypothetical protein